MTKPHPHKKNRKTIGSQPQNKGYNAWSNIKRSLYTLFPTFIRSIPHHKQIIRTSVISTFYVTLFVLLIINVVASQKLSPIYFGMVNDNQSSVISYLRLIRHSTIFNPEAKKFDTIYNNMLSNKIFQEEKQRSNQIQFFEQLLKDNPYSRDILYSLYSLYTKQGNHSFAQKYLQLAEAIDPAL